MDNLGKLRHVHFIRGRGCRLEADDGREFIDFTSAWGTISLGYADPRVVAAALSNVESGVLLPGPEQLSEKIRIALMGLFAGMERLLVFKTGTEACMAAIRISRAVTGRELIIRCGYHGWADWCNRGVGTVPPAQRRPFDAIPPGILASTAAKTLDLTDPDQPDVVEQLLKESGNQIACIIIDPTELSELPTDRLKALGDLCRRRGALFIVDELKTAFRVSARGAQGLCSVEPDLTVLGKGIGNGFPIAFVAGRASILDHPHGFTQGTFRDDRVALAAVLATVHSFVETDHCLAMTAHGQVLLDGINEIFATRGLAQMIKAVPWSHPTLPFLQFSEEASEIRERFFDYLIDEGIAWYRNHMCFINASHTAETITEALRRISIACDRLVKCG